MEIWSGHQRATDDDSEDEDDDDVVLLAPRENEQIRERIRAEEK